MLLASNDNISFKIYPTKIKLMNYVKYSFLSNEDRGELFQGVIRVFQSFIRWIQ